MRQKAALDHGSRAIRDEAPQKRRAQAQFGAEIQPGRRFRIQEQGLQRGGHHE